LLLLVRPEKGNFLQNLWEAVFLKLSVTDQMYPKEGFKVNVCYAVLYSLLSEIERRFTESHSNVLIGIHALNPISEKFADFTALKPFANAYGANETDLSHELHHAKRPVKRLDSVQKQKSKKYVGVNFVSRTVQRSIPRTVQEWSYCNCIASKHGSM